MLISGWIKTSLVDFPGKISTVIFTQGCNLNCFYCHNPELIDCEKTGKTYREDEILEYLIKRKGLVEGVVVTGGEPTIQKGLTYFLRRIKSLDIKVKLDTNGTNPEVLRELISLKLVDYFAMDIKTDMTKMNFVYGSTFDAHVILKSIMLIKNSGIDYEFRTTMAPGISLEDVRKILEVSGDEKKHYIQKCNGFADIPLLETDIMSLLPNNNYRGF